MTDKSGSEADKKTALIDAINKANDSKTLMSSIKAYLIALQTSTPALVGAVQVLPSDNQQHKYPSIEEIEEKFNEALSSGQQLDFEEDFFGEMEDAAKNAIVTKLNKSLDDKRKSACSVIKEMFSTERKFNVSLSELVRITGNKPHMTSQSTLVTIESFFKHDAFSVAVINKKKYMTPLEIQAFDGFLIAVKEIIEVQEEILKLEARILVGKNDENSSERINMEEFPQVMIELKEKIKKLGVSIQGCMESYSILSKNEYITSISLNICNDTLGSIMIQPAQRMPRWMLLTTELLKSIPGEPVEVLKGQAKSSALSLNQSLITAEKNALVKRRGEAFDLLLKTDSSKNSNKDKDSFIIDKAIKLLNELIKNSYLGEIKLKLLSSVVVKLVSDHPQSLTVTLDVPSEKLTSQQVAQQLSDYINCGFDIKFESDAIAKVWANKMIDISGATFSLLAIQLNLPEDLLGSQVFLKRIVNILDDLKNKGFKVEVINVKKEALYTNLDKLTENNKNNKNNKKNNELSKSVASLKENIDAYEEVVAERNKAEAEAEQEKAAAPVAAAEAQAAAAAQAAAKKEEEARQEAEKAAAAEEAAAAEVAAAQEKEKPEAEPEPQAAAKLPEEAAVAEVTAAAEKEREAAAKLAEEEAAAAAAAQAAAAAKPVEEAAAAAAEAAQAVQVGAEEAAAPVAAQPDAVAEAAANQAAAAHVPPGTKSNRIYAEIKERKLKNVLDADTYPELIEAIEKYLREVLTPPPVFQWIDPAKPVEEKPGVDRIIEGIMTEIAKKWTSVAGNKDVEIISGIFNDALGEKESVQVIIKLNEIMNIKKDILDLNSKGSGTHAYVRNLQKDKAQVFYKNYNLICIESHKDKTRLNNIQSADSYSRLAEEIEFYLDPILNPPPVFISGGIEKPINNEHDSVIKAIKNIKENKQQDFKAVLDFLKDDNIVKNLILDRVNEIKSSEAVVAPERSLLFLSVPTKPDKRGDELKGQHKLGAGADGGLKSLGESSAEFSQQDKEIFDIKAELLRYKDRIREKKTERNLFKLGLGKLGLSKLEKRGTQVQELITACEVYLNKDSKNPDLVGNLEKVKEKLEKVKGEIKKWRPSEKIYGKSELQKIVEKIINDLGPDKESENKPRNT